MRSGSSIAMFASQRCVQSNGTEITKEEMYDLYTSFCAENELSAATMKMFGTKFAFYVPYVSEGLISNGKGKRVRGWRNVTVSSSSIESESTELNGIDFESL